MRPQEGDHVGRLEPRTDRADREVRHLHEVPAPVATSADEVVLKRRRCALILARASKIEVERPELRRSLVLHQPPHVEQELLVRLREGCAVRVAKVEQIGMGGPDDEDASAKGGEFLEQPVGDFEPVGVAMERLPLEGRSREAASPFDLGIPKLISTEGFPLDPKDGAAEVVVGVLRQRDSPKGPDFLPAAQGLPSLVDKEEHGANLSAVPAGMGTAAGAQTLLYLST